VRSERIYVNEKSNDTSWDRTGDLPICSTPLCHRGPQILPYFSLNALQANDYIHNRFCCALLEGEYFFLGCDPARFSVKAVALSFLCLCVTMLLPIFGKLKHEGRFLKNRVFKPKIKGVLILCFMIYLLTANGLTPGGHSTVYIYTETIHRTT